MVFHSITCYKSLPFFIFDYKNQQFYKTNNLFFQQEAVSKAGDLISQRTLEQFWKETTMIIQKLQTHFFDGKNDPPPPLHTYSSPSLIYLNILILVSCRL